ncbi:YacL family protein [Paraglaciecola sp.]|uniref:UPF0231 family protein n=1 Tax=Paraglaciecola sp. TaxID=1920173 RepID=UPI003EF189E6
MEFQFQTDITGQPTAKCDLEYEAFGDWLCNDLGTDRAKIHDLLNTIEQLLNKKIPSFELTGKEYHLVFENDEVELSLNNNQTKHDEFSQDFDANQTTGCGLIDFQQLLQAWKNFIR